MNSLKSYDLIKDKEYPMFTRAELAEIKRLAKTLPDNPIIVIIGAGIGAASMAILEELDNVLIFSIDIEFPTQQAMYKPGERANLIEAGYWQTGKVIQVWGDSQTVGLNWPIGYDYLIIDGDHRYDAVKKDIEIWLKHSNRNGIVSLHDYASKDKKPRAGVKQAVDELIKPDKDFISLVHTLVSFQL